MATIQFKRGTQAELDSAAGNNELQPGEPYWIDGNKLAVGSGASDYKRVDAGAILAGGADADFVTSPQIDGKTMFSGFKGFVLVENGAMPGSPDADLIYFEKKASP